MKLTGRRESSNVEDRRGMSGGAKLGIGGGLGGIIIIALMTFMQGGNLGDVVQNVVQQQMQAPTETVDEQNFTEEEQELASDCKKILASTEEVWTKVFEENGKFGIRDHKGEVLVSPQYDFLRTCYTYVDDLVTMPIIAQKNGKLGLILPDRKDTVVADFIYDDIQLRDEPPYFEAYQGKKKVRLEGK